ncbi:TonB-dependent receptor [Mucilaginibacter koreensis]
MKILCLLTACILFSYHLQAQRSTHRDSVTLDSVLIRESRNRFLPDVAGSNIFSGKRTHLIYTASGSANLANNNARMLFAQIPGVNVWEMDGAGTQINVGTRGTDTHRSIETNMRQNGYNFNSDIFGYPEAHYTPPMQGVGQIQVVRGSAALQFGSQYGGMFNFKMKEGDPDKPFTIESEQSAGSNRFFNSFNAIGGTTGKLNYYAYFDNRSGDGWRSKAAFNYQAFYAHLRYQFNAKGSITFEFSRMNYRQQIAGGLTDAQFAADNRQSTRFRNFFSPEINLPAFIFNYNFNPATKLEVTSHVLFGQRNSVQFLANANVPDTVNTTLKTYNPRQVDRDYYLGFTTEARLLHTYQLGNLRSTITGGIRYFTEETRRKQKGVGTTGFDYDLTLTQPYGIDLNLNTINYAAFAENIFQVTPRFSVTPGVRFEMINTDTKGVINSRQTPVAYTGKRRFPLFGFGLQYQVSGSTQLYGNISQAYRPYIYANVTPADQLAIIDPNLKDTKGYDIDLGYRGNVHNLLSYDIAAYYVYYGNRVGNLTLTDASGTHLYTTNVGNLVAKGVEAYVNFSLLHLINPDAASDIKLFNSLAYDHARYTSGSVNQSGVNVSLVGKRAEGTPALINRAGLIYLNRHVLTTLEYTYVGKNYSDANNTVFNATGLSGIVPAYHVFDWAFSYSFLQHYHLTANVNNIFNAKYFTRRINMYPGPGILPADGTTFNVGIGLKL